MRIEQNRSEAMRRLQETKRRREEETQRVLEQFNL